MSLAMPEVSLFWKYYDLAIFFLILLTIWIYGLDDKGEP